MTKQEERKGESEGTYSMESTESGSPSGGGECKGILYRSPKQEDEESQEPCGKTQGAVPKCIQYGLQPLGLRMPRVLGGQVATA